MVETIREPEHPVPVAERCDVLVCGGGRPVWPRQSLPLERGALDAPAGGAGLPGRHLDGWPAVVCARSRWQARPAAGDRDPSRRSRRSTLVEHDAQRPWVDGSFYYDPEIMKLVLEQVCEAAGVALQLHTRVVATIQAQPGHLAYALTESKSGRQAWGAQVFVDCTGDGDLAALAGCGFDVGRPGSGETQPMTLMAIVGGIREEELARAHPRPSRHV